MKPPATTNSTSAGRCVTARAWCSRILSLAVTTAMVFASVPAAVAAPKGKRAAATASAETDGRTIALVRFTGAGGSDMRLAVKSQLEDEGYTVRSVALDPAEAAKKVKCRGAPTTADCLGEIGKWLNSNPKTAADFVVYGDFGAGPGARGELGIFDIKKSAMVERFDVAMYEQDLILSITLPQAVTTKLRHHLEPPAPATEEEQAIIAALDEPEKTPEEIAAERKALEEAQALAAASQQDTVIDTDAIEVDLKADFKDYCREGARTKRKTKEEPKDLRPKCSRGTFWGYWQPRAWVALGLATGTLVGTGVAYGMALGARGPYKRAVSDLDAFRETVPGDPRTDPNSACNAQGECYDALATEVSRTGSIMRRRAIIGDVLLGTSVLLTGILAIIIYQDRTDAKNYIKQEKGLRAISSTLRVGPILSAEQKGMGLGFRF